MLLLLLGVGVGRAVLVLQIAGARAVVGKATVTRERAVGRARVALHRLIDRLAATGAACLPALHAILVAISGRPWLVVGRAGAGAAASDVAALVARAMRE